MNTLSCDTLALAEPWAMDVRALGSRTSAPRTFLGEEGIAEKKFASEPYCAIGGVARNSIANCTVVGAEPPKLPFQTTIKWTFLRLFCLF